jgi:hypothetical protein
MIGRKVSDMCLDGKKLQFYQWGEGADVKALLEKVRIKVSIITAYTHSNSYYWLQVILLLSRHIRCTMLHKACEAAHCVPIACGTTYHKHTTRLHHVLY